MYIENLCCVAKGLQKAAEKISPVVWVYTAGEDEEAVDIFNQNFFYDVVEKLRTDDLLLIYTPLESTKIYWAKIIKIHNNITLEAISTGGGAGGDVISVNGKNGVVVLSATDILNQAQLDSVNSGITAEKVAEYDHNLEEFEQLSGEVATLEAEQQTIKSDLGDLGDQVIENNNAIATKNNIFQLDVFPDLNTPNVPNPFQYVGETIGSAIKGHIYEKVETDFTQWERNDNQTYVVTMGGALVGDDVYQADGKTVIGTITDISDDAMTYTDTDGQSISTTYHSVFHTAGFEEVYTFGDDIDLSDYAKRNEVYTRDNADALFIKNTEKGQANGVATLNNMGVIPSEQVNISSLNVKGTWDASTNTPALTNGVGESGDFYITSVAGSVDFGAGEINFAVGDWALYTDSGVWEKSVNASAVQSVNGKTGLVNVLDTDVLNEEQLKAVNSGIDEVKVAQIETNKTDIAETKTSLEELSMQVATNTGTIETKLDKTTDVANAGKVLTVGDDGAIGFSEAKGKIYTSLESLGLVAPVGVGDIFNALPDNSTAQLNGEDKEGEGSNVVITDIPASFGILTIRKVTTSRFSIDFQNSLGSAPCNVKRWIGTLKGVDGTGLTWKELALKDNFPFYTALSQLGLDTTSSLHDITRILPKGGTIAFKVDAMANKAEYNNIMLGTVTIHKVEDARVQAIMTSKSDGRTWIGKLDGNNDIVGWNELGHTSFSTLDQLGLDDTATIDDVVSALPSSSTALFAVTAFANYQTMFPYNDGNDQFGRVLFIKGNDNGRTLIRWFRKDGKNEAIGMQSLNDNSFAGWKMLPNKTYSALRRDTQHFTIDIKKQSPGLNGNLIFSYNKDGKLEQVLLSTIGANEVRWTRLTRASAVQNVTYTIDANDNSHITIGVDLNDKAYGTHQVDVIGEVATISSFTGEEYVGDSTAVLYFSDERVHVSLEELGLTADATPSDVIRVLPVGGQAAIDVGSFTNWETLFPKDEDNDNLATFTVVKGYDVHGSRTVATYVKKDASKIAYGGISANNQIQWWNKLSIKGAGDVGSTSDAILPITGVTVNSDSRINHYIKNGVCCVAVQLRMSIQTAIDTWTNVAVELPKPAINISQTVHSERNKSDLTMAFRITAGGTLQMIFTGTTTTDDWWTTTFTYPVA